ncbi:MAG: nitrate/nitrite transporter, partial [Halolamina sp.]
PMVRDATWRRGVLAGAWTMMLFAAAVQIMPASVLPLVMDDLAVGPGRAGWLVSASLITPALLSLFVGVALDRFASFRVVMAGTLVLVVANVWGWWAALAGDFVSLVVTRLLAGAAIATLWNAGATVVGGVFTGKRAATAMGVFTTAPPLGYAIGQFVPPFVAEAGGWELNFLVFAVLSLLAFLAYALVGGRNAAGTPEERPTRAEFRAVFTSRTVWVVALMSFVGYSLHLFFNSWMPTYLSEEFGMALTASGALAALFPAMGVLSRLSGGWLSDRVFARRRKPIPLLAFGVSAPLVVLVSMASTTLALVALLALSGYFIQLSIGLFYTYVRELVDDRVAGSAVAVLSTASFVGASSSPVIAAALFTRTGTFAASFGYAAALALAGFALALFAPEPARGNA